VAALNLLRAARSGWSSGEANLFGLLSLALVVPVTFSFKQFLDHRRQMAALERVERDLSKA
jgi:hypothetical protein